MVPSKSLPASRSPRNRIRRSSHQLLEPLEQRTLYSATPAQLVAQADNAVAFDLFHELAKTSSNNNVSNLFFSPYSIATALQMTLQGAKGVTATEMIRALHLPATTVAQAGIQALYQLFQADPTTAGYTLSTANRLWVNKNFPLLQSFVTGTRKTFGAAAQPVDFSNPTAAANIINTWVAAQTHNKIPSIISPEMIHSFTSLILANAIYFKADWASVFPTTSTHAATFHLSPTQSSTVQMMSQENNFGYYQKSGPNGFQALDLPYQGNNVDMLAILPTSSNLNGLESALTPALFSTITSHLATTDVQVNLPEFKVEETYNLIPALKDLGIHAAFNNADFSGLSSRPTSIAYVVHKSYIQVDETGTEAAAVTGVGIIATAIPIFSPAATFTADHPFIVAIRDRATNTILFLGAINNIGTPAPATSIATVPTAPASNPSPKLSAEESPTRPEPSIPAGRGRA